MQICASQILCVAFSSIPCVENILSMIWSTKGSTVCACVRVCSETCREMANDAKYFSSRRRQETGVLE